MSIKVRRVKTKTYSDKEIAQTYFTKIKEEIKTGRKLAYSGAIVKSNVPKKLQKGIQIWLHTLPLPI